MGNYYTLAQARTDGLTIGEASDDAVSQAINEAEELIEKFCKRKFYSRTLALYLDGTGTEWLNLFQYRPINSITSLKINDETIDDDYYKIYSDEGYIRIKRVGTSVYSSNAGLGYYVFSKGSQNIKVVGSFGFSVVPYNIIKVTRLLVFREFRAGQKIGKFVSEKIGDYSYSLKDISEKSILTGDPEIDKLLRMYKDKISMFAIHRQNV